MPGRSSELICWIKEMNPGIVLKMDSCVYHEKNADVLELAQYPYDLWEIGEQEWIYWLDLLQKKSRYDRIILNFANTPLFYCGTTFWEFHYINNR